MARATASLSIHYRLQVASRVLAALACYGLTSLIGIVLALLWPIPQAQAVLSSIMLSFAIYAALILWVFSVKSLRTLWLVLVIGSAVFGLLVRILLPEASV
ncbi:iron transporter [Pseudomonas sp. FME51]|uniref:iron transporter n=1 Tax=Pseudomonas sp. FME51 TaxID=2742609 RepID=UPI001869134F|nr:iron transporter [Pseudomonas sp. FME51]